MRLTGGQLNGRPLAGGVPEGARPTPARVREALFSILGQSLAGQVVLDGYAGAGMLGFEALSRGAARVVAIDQSRGAVMAMRRSAQGLGVQERHQAVQGALPGALPTGPFDLVLLDPPYALDAAPVLRALVGRVRGIIVLEHDPRRAPPEVEGLEGVDRRRYGDTALCFYRPSAGDGLAPVDRNTA